MDELQFGEQLKEMRKDVSFSQEALALKANISLSAVKNLESGSGSTIKTFLAYIDALGLTERLLHFSKPDFGFSFEEVIDKLQKQSTGLPQKLHVNSVQNFPEQKSQGN